MKTVGLIGGISWEMSTLYGCLIHERVRNRRGRLHSAHLLLHQFDAEELVRLQRQEEWSKTAQMVSDVALGLYGMGARCFALCSHTLHRTADQVRETLPIDATLLHIGDGLGAAIRASGTRRVGLLGTRYTMEQTFLSEYLLARYQIRAFPPAAPKDREYIHKTIFEELSWGVIRAESRRELARIASDLREEQGAEAVILASTELMLLIGEETGPFPLPRFASTTLHAHAIADYILAADPSDGDIIRAIGEFIYPIY